MSEDSEKKEDVKSLLNVIPPASALKGNTRQGLKEKRVKIRKRADVGKGTVLISTKLASELSIKGSLEISVKGRREKFKAVVQEGIVDYEIWASSPDMIELGLMDNSTVTVRASQ
ncbi:hypothetical protein [Sulfuracidifex metallicus]|uniref:hypothetical protein n=1 Tax=Sulfuracidifex metallicus TaxID=47303 RepID=UPI0022766D70|nr:hypothetical protein [Sulfuracidifex metallicus]MCY0850571.1 hypothetical protein [Sulfuracidifex metallicus]